MISWLNTPIDVTPGTQGAWTDVDHAAVPDGAKGVFLCFENNVTANPPGDKDIGARKNGSSDTFLSKGYWNNSPAGVGTHIHVQVGVDASGVFEVYIEDTSLSKCWLLGYWENDANVVMLTNAVDKTPTRDDTWRTVDIASDTGADTAAAAIITHYQPDGNYESSGVRKIGSANTSMYGGHWYNTTIVTLNGSEQFEARVAAGGASKIYLVGYLKGGWVDAESVGPWTDPTVSQAWRSPTLADKPAGATDEYVAAIGLCWYGVTPNARGLRHRRWGSWDVRRKLSKDGLHWMTIPLDRARKFDDWMYDQPNQYGFVYGYVKRTISAPAGGTALVHLVKEDYTERTTTSTTEIEVTQHTIAWADLTAAGFAAGDEVIIIGKACVGGASTTALQANYRASRGTSFAGRTTWTDSALLHEPNKTTAAQGCAWQWVKKHTLVVSENLYFSLATNSSTARVDDFVLMVVKLGGSGGLATDDWRYAETTPTGNASTTYTDGASVTLPGAKKSSWAIMTSAHWLIDSTSADLLQKIVVGSDSLCEARHEGENTSEERTYGNLAVVHYIGADTTAKVQYRVDTASTHDCVRTAIFALRLDAFESWSLDSTLLSKTLSALDTYQTLFDTGFQQRDSTARDVIYFGTARSGATGDAAKALYGQIREGANEWPAAGSDRAAYTGAGTADQLAPWWCGKKTSVAQGNYNLNFRVAEDDDVSPTYTVPEAYFFAFVPRLAAGTSAIDLVLASPVHAHSSDAPTLTQAHQLAMQDGGHAHGVDVVTLTQAHVLALVDALHAHSSDAPSLTQAHVLAAADGGHAHGCDAPTLTQAHQLALADGGLAHSVDIPSLTQAHVLAAADGGHAHSSDAVTLQMTVNLAPVSSEHAHAADAPSLTQTHVLALVDALHAHVSDAVTLQVAVNLTPTACDHSHGADALTLTQIHILALQDNSHAHAAANVTLEVAGTLGVQPADHIHATGNVVLTQAHVLALADALQAVIADNVALTQAHILALADALHGHLADALAVIQTHQLAVSSGEHAHAADVASLTQTHQLALAEGAHGHLADHLSFDQVHQLVAQSADHAQLATSPVLTQVHLVVVSDALFAHLAEALTLTLTNPYAPSGERLLILRAEDRLIALVAESRLLAASADERLFTIH